MSLFEQMGLSTEDIKQRTRAFENEIRIMRSDINNIRFEAKEQALHVKENREKIKMNKVVRNLSFPWHLS